LIFGAVSPLLMSGGRISFGRIIFREIAVHGIDEARAQQAAIVRLSVKFNLVGWSFSEVSSADD
jgi:hypothetical protein